MTNETKSKIVLSLSIGTIFSLFGLIAIGAVVLIALHASCPEAPERDKRFPNLWSPNGHVRREPAPNAGSLEPRSDIDRYGPVNSGKLDEKKEGRLLDRLLHRSECPPQTRFTHPVYVESKRVCGPCPPAASPGSIANCTSCVTVAPHNAATEQPLVAPCLNCVPKLPDFNAAPRGEKKTGGFACTNCGAITVGDDWETEWTDDGTPVTFLCKSCWDSLNVFQRKDAYQRWVKRQQAGIYKTSEYPAN